MCKKRETHFNNVTMTTFRVPIVFRSVRRRGEGFISLVAT